MDHLAADQVCYDAPGHACPVEHFDFAAVDAALGNEAPPTPADARTDAADLLNDIFHWCADAPTARSASLRFLCLLAGCRPELLASRSYKSLASEFSVTRAAFCKTMMAAEAKFKMKFARTRCLEGREHMREARLRQILPDADSHAKPPARRTPAVRNRRKLA